MDRPTPKDSKHIQIQLASADQVIFKAHLGGDHGPVDATKAVEVNHVASPVLPSVPLPQYQYLNTSIPASIPALTSPKAQIGSETIKDDVAKSFANVIIHNYQPPSKVLPAVVQARPKGCQVSIRTPAGQFHESGEPLVSTTIVQSHYGPNLGSEATAKAEVVDQGHEVLPALTSPKVQIGSETVKEDMAKTCADGIHDYERLPHSKVLPAVVRAQIEGCHVSIRTPAGQFRESDIPETFVCRGCKKVLSRRKKLCITVVVEGGGSDLDSKTFSLKSECGKMCHVCHRHFPQKIELAKHLIQEHDLTQLTKTLRKRDRKKVLPEEEVKKLEEAEVDEETTEVQCSRVGCHKTFAGRRAYLDHLAAVHRGESKVFECEECGKVFNHKGHLNKHKYIHTGECPFMCAHCGKRFNQKANLKAHLQTHMPKVNKKYWKVAMEGEEVPGGYICDHCGRDFFSLAGLQIHAKTHVTEKKSYACPQCPEVFDKFVDLKFHKQGHSGLKQWQCTECNKKCPSKSSWDEHMRIHTGERPHSCHLCGKGFKQKSTLVGHYKNIHGPNPKKVKDKPCPHCSEKFSSKCALQKHVKGCQVLKAQIVSQMQA